MATLLLLFVTIIGSPFVGHFIGAYVLHLERNETTWLAIMFLLTTCIIWRIVFRDRT